MKYYILTGEHVDGPRGVVMLFGDYDRKIVEAEADSLGGDYSVKRRRIYVLTDDSQEAIDRKIETLNP